jgi:hypothetical protein
MNRAEKILSEVINKGFVDLEWEHEVQCIRPSEALEAMKEIAWQAWNERAKTSLGELYNEHAQGHLFEKWYNQQEEKP